ncbi:hypothetical protein [Streptomyces sp. NPDC050560]|uniref:hypothetical protein n=1 Tax=Streptomyces sp. NPDC050560 TaxID=3365630 RepID=UPI0037BC6B93
MTLRYRDLREVDLGKLDSAVADWKKVADDLRKLKGSAENGLKAKSDSARWEGVNAGVTRGFVNKTAKEIADLSAEADSIHHLLDDAHRELVRIQKKLIGLVAEAEDRSYVVTDEAADTVTVSARTAPGEPVNEDAATERDLKHYADQISSCLLEAETLDQVVAFALGRVHGRDPYNAGHKTYDSLKDAEIDPAAFQYPPEASDDRYRAAWASAEPGEHDKWVFRETWSLADTYMALAGNKRSAEFLTHWLDNTGEPMRVRPTEMMGDLESFRSAVQDELRPGKFDSGWKSGSVHDELRLPGGGDRENVQDWFHTLNGYQYRVRGDTTAEGEKLTGEVTVDVYKRYNWGNPAGGKHRDDLGPEGWMGSLTSGVFDIKQNDLAHLHTTGMARDYDVIGHETFHIG